MLPGTGAGVLLRPVLQPHRLSGDIPPAPATLGLEHLQSIATRADLAILRDLDKRIIASVPDSLQAEGLSERLNTANHFGPGPGHIATLTDNHRQLYQLVSPR